MQREEIEKKPLYQTVWAATFCSAMDYQTPWIVMMTHVTGVRDCIRQETACFTS